MPTVKTIAKLAGLVVLLNVVRYTVGGWIEGFTIMEPMHRPLPLFRRRSTRTSRPPTS